MCADELLPMVFFLGGVLQVIVGRQDGMIRLTMDYLNGLGLQNLVGEWDVPHCVVVIRNGNGLSV
jgi:hypothetical protein